MVAYTSAGSGQGSNRSQPFFAKQSPPSKPVEDITIERLSPTSINVSWTPLTLCEAQGFPIYRVVVTLSGGGMKRQLTSLTNTTTSSSLKFIGLDRNSEYSVVVGVRSQGVPGDNYNESVRMQGKKHHVKHVLFSNYLYMLIILNMVLVIFALVFCNMSNTIKYKYAEFIFNYVPFKSIARHVLRHY